MVTGLGGNPTFGGTTPTDQLGKDEMMRLTLLLVALTALSACETWNGFKKDVVTGADAIQDAI